MRKLLLALLLLLACGCALFAPSYIRYQRTRGATPPGVRLAGYDFSQADTATVASTLNRVYGEPAAIHYADQRIFLRPQMVGFQVDVEAMLAEARQHERLDHLLRIWTFEALHRDQPPVEIRLRYHLDRDALDNWLADIAVRYDRPPTPARALRTNFTIIPGLPGRQMDLPASRASVIAALTDPRTRTANLVLRETAPPPANIALLTELLQARIAQFPGVAGLFLHHIPTGDEAAINADVAFSAMSTMKIALLAEVYRKLDAAPDATITAQITETIALAGNRAANELLALIGDGSATEGVRIFNGSLRTLGLRNSFMAAPYDQPGPRVATTANRQGQPSTRPDPYVQTTPREMGLMLSMIVACGQGGGALLAAFPNQLTQAECQQLLDLMRLNDVTALIVSGLPKGVRAIHKHGYVAETHGDVAAIWGPVGPYVLSIFLHRPGWLEWDFSSATMGELSRIAWDYFALVSRQ